MASTDMEAGLSHGHREIASIVLPATNPNSALPEFKVAESMVRRTNLPIVAGQVIAIPKAGVPKIREVSKGSQKGKKDKPRFRKYDNVDQNELGSDDPEVYDEVNKMTIYYDAMKVHYGTVLFDEIDGLERHECYENDPIISGPESSHLSSSKFHTSSNIKTMGDQINSLERSSLLYDHCVSDPERK